MFSNLTVLIAEDDQVNRQCVERCAHALSFNTVSVSAIRDGLDALPNADIFIMDLMLVNGDATLLLERWVRDNGGPCCVLSGYITDDVEADLIVAGAWNIIRKPYRLEMLQTTLYRYGSIVKRERAHMALEEEYKALKGEMKTVKRNQIYLGFLAIAALAGAAPTAIPKIIEIISKFII